MDDRLKNLHYARSRKLACILLGLLISGMLVINRAIYPVMCAIPFSSRNWFFPIVYGMSGMIVAEVALVMIWTVLGPHSFLRRLLFLVFAGLALLAAWTLGFAATLNQTARVDWWQKEEVSLFGFFPIVFLVGASPLIVLRIFASRRLAQVHETPSRQPVTIASLLVWTCLVAIVIAAVQLPAKTFFPQNEAWMIVGIMSAFTISICLLLVLPAVLLLLSRRRSFWPWAIGWWLTTAGLTAGTLFLVDPFLKFPITRISTGLMILIPAMIVVTLGIGIMRLFGYRLTKSTKP